MEHELALMDRLDTVVALLERAVASIEDKAAVMTAASDEVNRISATIEQSQREAELADKLSAAQREIAQLQAGLTNSPAPAQRKTVPAATSEMLAKHGIQEAPVDVRMLDAALAGLSLEQRIAVKSQLLRAGAIG